MEREVLLAKPLRQNKCVKSILSLSPTLRVTYSYCFSDEEASASNVIISTQHPKTDLVKILETVDEPNTMGPVLETGEACG